MSQKSFPSITFVATDECIETYCEIDPECNVSQIKNFIEMLEMVSFDNSLVFEQVIAALEDLDHPMKEVIMNMMPLVPYRELPAIQPTEAWK